MTPLRAYRAIVRDITGKEGRVTVRATSYEQAKRMIHNGNCVFLKWVQ